MIALAGVAIHSKIYESSASLVYRGIREADNRALVVKLLKPDYPSPQELTRYRQEYEITRFLKLDGVVKAYSQQDYQRTLVIFLEDFGGESLEHWMRQRPEAICPMPLSTFLPLAIDLTNILGQIHAAHIIHKDVNPGNIVFNPDTGVVKIIDLDLVHLPQMTEPDKLAAMRILSRVTTATWIIAPDLMLLLVSKQVSLSIEHGNAFASPFAYANYGLVLCGKVGDIDTGYEFGQLALKLSSQTNTDALRARTLLIVNNFIIPWKEHIREIFQPLLEGYQSGLQTGDLEFAAYCAYVYCNYSYFAGKALMEVEHSITTYGESIRQLKQETVLIWSEIYHQTVANLLGYLNSPDCLGNEFYNENELTEHKAANDVTSYCIFLVCFNKLFLYYLFSNYSQAVKNSAIAERYVIYLSASSVVPLYYFYNSLARLATYPTSSTQAQEILEKVAVSQEKMEYWARYAPMNYLHKYHLVEAEKARVLGQLLEAEEFYEQAIQGAKDNDYLQEEALAYELAAKFYLARGREKIAQTYMKEAHYCYERWGATAKVKDLETRYPQFFAQLPKAVHTRVGAISGITSSRSDTVLDLEAVLKASQAICREIELEQLLRSLMQILIENAGAQIGSLILENSGEWLIEAACELNGSPELPPANALSKLNDSEEDCATRVLQSIPTTNRLPESMIQYVIRTHESVILNDATREGNFIDDPYVQRNQPLSILCLPLLNQNQLVGVLYLENQLVAGAFTPERSRVLNLLSTQAAIAIENARLYSQLRAKKSQITQFLEAVPVGIGVIDTLGRPCYVNQQAIELLGKGLVPSIPDQFAEVYQLYLAGTDQNYPTENLPIVRALSGERSTVDNLEIHQNGAIVPLEVRGTPIFDEQSNVAYAIAAFQDITERKQAERLLANYNRILEQQVAQRTAALQASEAALSEREQELRLITDALPVCISYVDADQYFRFVNRTYEDWFNRSRDQILGKHIREILGERAYQLVEPYINQVMGGQTQTYEVEVPYPSGKKYVCVTYIPAFDRDAQVRGYYALVVDIGEQRDAALRERKRAEAASILEERNRMAREIHDTLAQAFTGIIVHMGAISRLASTNPEAIQTHSNIVRDLARSGLTEARRSVAALRPQSLEEGNLWTALEQFVSMMQSSTETRLSCEIVGTPYPLPPETENNLLKIGQEAFTNAIKYAHATEIQIELTYKPTSCCLRVIDNGRGFEANNTTLSQGFGLLGIAERTERIRAQLSIESGLGQGTEVVVSVNREIAA